MAYFGGVEGGATNTTAIIVDATGAIIARQDGSGSNGWLLGAAKVADLLIELFHAAKKQAGIPLDTPLEAMGLCMSGFLQPRIQDELRAAFAEKDPRLCKRYYIDNDSPGSVFTASGPRGGLVIISGTGTMAQLITPSGKAVNCGGWGHMFGDEASAYYIAANAIRRIFWALDRFIPDVPAGGDAGAPIPDVTQAHKLMLEYFQIADKDGMLDVFYKSFEKARVAGFTKHLAAAASAGDAFCASLFVDAGTLLGSMARTLAPHLLLDGSSSDSGNDVHGLDIVCVGSVWKSWELLKPGFAASVTAPFHAVPAGAPAGGRVASYRLLRLTQSSALGAAWKGAAEAGVSLPIDFNKNVEVLFAGGREW